MFHLRTLQSAPATLMARRAMSSILKPPVPQFNTVACVGLGLMGHGIAQVTATTPNSKVIAFESEQRFLDSGRQRIEGSLARIVKKGKMDQKEMDRILGNIKYTTDPSDLKSADLVVEAVIENMDLKKKLYGELHRVCKPEAIFASNTSSLSITDMALVSGRADRFVGVHFFNPVQMMKLVEVISTKHTHPDVHKACEAWVKDIGKVSVSCGDTPGFIVNRLLVPTFIQAMLMVDRKDATVKDIDVSLVLGAGHPMGPLHLSDFIGLDTIYNIIRGWCDKYPNEPTFIMPKCLETRYKAGHLGRKTGKGFYNWAAGDVRGDAIEEK